MGELRWSDLPSDLEPSDLLMEKFRSLEDCEELCGNMISTLDEYIKLIEHFQNPINKTAKGTQMKLWFDKEDFPYYEPELHESYVKRQYKLKTPARIMELQSQIQSSRVEWNRCLTIVETEMNRRREIWARKAANEAEMKTNSAGCC